MEDKILNVISNVMHKDITVILNSLDESNFIDSLQKMEIIFGLEDAMDISFSPEDISKFNTVRDLLEITKNK